MDNLSAMEVSFLHKTAGRLPRTESAGSVARRVPLTLAASTYPICVTLIVYRTQEWSER